MCQGQNWKVSGFGLEIVTDAPCRVQGLQFRGKHGQSFGKQLLRVASAGTHIGICQCITDSGFVFRVKVSGFGSGIVTDAPSQGSGCMDAPFRGATVRRT